MQQQYTNTTALQLCSINIGYIFTLAKGPSTVHESTKRRVVIVAGRSRIRQLLPPKAATPKAAGLTAN